MKRYAIACDVGRKRDHYTEMVWEDTATEIAGIPALGQPARLQHSYGIIWLKRLIDPTYEEMIVSAATLAGRPELMHNADLLIDGNGVGDAVVEGLRKKKLYPIPIIATGGVSAHAQYDDPFGAVFGDSVERTQSIRALRQITVPKAHLVTAGIVLLEQHRIGLAEGLPPEEVEAFIEQLQAFRQEHTQGTKHIAWNAADDEVHDDYVSALLMLAWWTARTRGNVSDRILQDRNAGSTWREGDGPMNIFDRDRTRRAVDEK